MDEKKVFVVGCFNFVPKDKSVELKDYDYEGYIQTVSDTLKKVPNITNIKSTPVLGTLAVFPEISPIDKSNPIFYPYPSMGGIYFEIDIPISEQEIYFDIHPLFKSNTRTYKVIIYYTPFVPTVFVEFSSSEKEPFIAFRVLNKYLKNLFDKDSEFPIEFVSLGSWPILKLHISPALEKTLISKYISNLCHDSLIFEYDTSLYSSINQASDDIIKDYHFGIGFLFHIRLAKNFIMSQMRYVDRFIDELNNKQVKNNLFYQLFGGILASKEIKSALLASAELELNYIKYKEWLRDRSGWAESFLIEPLDTLAEKKFKDFCNMEYPNDEIYKLINFFENRSISYKSIIGGIIGGILVLALSMLVEHFVL